MKETSLLTEEDLIIKSRIADRTNRIKTKEQNKKNLKFINELAEQFGSFKKFIQNVDYECELGIIYDKEKRTKTCTICGLVMPIHSMLSVHRKKCGGTT